MDLAPLEQAAVTAAAGIISACGLVAVSYIRAHVKNAEAQILLAKAATNGAVVARDSLTAAFANGAPDWAAAKHVAVSEGLAEAQKLSLEVTRPDVVTALAPLLAVDRMAPVDPAASVAPITTTLVATK